MSSPLRVFVVTRGVPSRFKEKVIRVRYSGWKVDMHVRNALRFVRHPDGFDSKLAFLYCVNTHFIEAAWSRFEMAKANGSVKAKTMAGYDVKFVNRNLTAEEKEQHDARPIPFAKLAQEWVKLTVQGYVTKISWDNYSKCYQATLTVWQSDNVNFGYGLSARGATPERAISLLMFKHADVLGENWAESYKPAATDMEG